MPWTVIFHDDFDPEFDQLAPDVQDGLLAVAKAVQFAGPKAGRPHVDTLSESKHSKMKEMRFKAARGTQVWRAAFAFDRAQQAVVLVAAEKQGTDEKRFYRSLIRKADDRFDRHLRKHQSSQSKEEAWAGVSMTSSRSCRRIAKSVSMRTRAEWRRR